MEIPELYIFCGGCFCIAYGIGWVLEQREITKRIEKQRTAVFDLIVSPKGRELIDKHAKMWRKIKRRQQT